MKHHLKLIFWAITALALPTGANAATLTQAQITWIVKDVRTIDPGKSARAAVMKETVQGEQSVRTGIASRTELLFNDKTITRLGANTHFSFAEGTRDMSLQSGVMLLQVPKGIGGAKIETSAVTAGITGTTILLEQSLKYTKLIVLEGECYLVAKLNGGKFSGRVWAHAGEEIIFLNSTGKIPPPVFINLRLLENTSLLINGRWGVRLNVTPIIAAANNQKPGDFVPVNTGGIGAYVTDTTGKLPPATTTQPNPAPAAPTPPPAAPTPPPHNTIR